MFFQQLAESFSAFSAGRLKTPANALRQCTAPSRCEIQLHNNSVVQIAIRISDLIQQIFQPFYRPDYSRNRKDGGTGLGLFIVQQILDKHGLRYQFEAVDGRKMRFSIYLPTVEK